jgi:predicted naringenin-chalcone synthase
MVAFEEHAGGLAAAAARKALSRCAVAPSDLGDLVTVSCSGFFAPGVDVGLVRDLGLAPGTGRTHVGFMGCHGALNGLRVARGLCAARPGSRTLLVAVELCSIHFQYGWEPERIVANALFADGAAACVLGPSTDIPGVREADSWSLLDVGTHLFPGTEDLMTWKIGDHGFVMSLSAAVPEVLEGSLRPWVEEWLAHNGLGLSDIASWAIHPGGPRILSSVEKALLLPRQACTVSREVLARHGNMSSPTVLFLLERLQARHAPLPCVALAFGPGLVAEGALFG